MRKRLHHQSWDGVWRRSLCAGVLVLGLAAVGQPQEWTVDSELRPPKPPSDAAQGPYAQPPTQDDTANPTALSITLPAVTDAELVEGEQRNATAPLQIGFGREIPSAYQDDLAPRLAWVTRGDGRLVSRLRITSPGARALRVAVSATLGPGAELRFLSPANPGQRFGPLTQHNFTSPVDASSGPSASLGQDAPLWSPVIDGKTVGIAITLPSSAGLSLFSLYVEQVSHFVSAPHQNKQYAPHAPQSLGDIGGATCSSHIDVHCRNVATEASATAKMIFTNEDGTSSQCTGVLMADRDAGSYLPYFLTAHHCIATQAVARSLVTYWDFERARCGGAAPITVTQLDGGADLLVTQAKSDSTLLRLRRAPPRGPKGRWYAGWSSAALNHPTKIYGVHHSGGDLKKYSDGITTGFKVVYLDENENEQFDSGEQVVEVIDVRWLRGAAEPGSSGSGLFDADGYLRGVLSGGRLDEGCFTITSSYGRFDLFFPHARRWLAGDDVLASPPPDDHGNSPGEATRIEATSSTPGHLEAVEDVDYFRISVSQAGTLTVETTGSTDTVGRLRSATGQVLSSNDDAGTGRNFRFVQSISAGRYYIRVSGYQDFGQYTLVVRFTPGERVTPGGRGLLESPGNGGKLSGLGFISGWKCNAGTITVTLNGGVPIRVATKQPRGDTRHVCGTTDNGFIAQMNWAALGDGVHTAVAYDNGVEFSRSTFEVATAGAEFVRGARARVRVENFPTPGQTTLFEWNEATQHLEMVLD